MKLLLDLLITINYWLVNLAYVVISFIPFCIVALFSKKAAHQFAVFWGKTVIWLMFLPVKVNGIENVPKEAVIITSNHTSMLDIHLTLGFLPKNFNFLLKDSLMKIPLMGTVMRILGFFPINRDNPREAIKSINNLVKHLQTGTSVLIYPEGTRNPSPKMLPFKGGIGKIALAAQIPVLPINVKGCDKVNSAFNKLCHWHPLAINIGQPIYSHIGKNNSKENQNNIKEEIKNAIENLYY